MIDESLLANDVRTKGRTLLFFVFVLKLSNGLALGISTAVYKYINA